MRSLPWVLLALSCLGCGGDDDGGDEGPLPPEPTLVAGDYSLDVLYKSGHIDLRRGDDVLVSLPVDAFVLGTVTQLDDLTNYDPEPFLAGSPGAVEPDGLTWRKSRSFRVTEASESFVEVRIGHEGGLTSFLHLTVTGEGNFDAHLAPASPNAQIAYLAVSPAIDESEALYGLGEYFDSVDNRGKLRAMQLEAKGDIESSYNEAHVPIPFVTSTKAWGLFVEDPYPAVFDVGKTDPTRINAIFGKGLASNEGLHFHLFGAEHPLDVTKRYYDITGYPRLPAPWGLGPLVWRDENVDQAQVEGDLDAMRTLDLPTSAIWIDRPYATGVNTFDFDVAKFPDSAAMIKKAHDLGFRMSLWHTPYLDEADPSTQALRDEANQNGYYPPAHGIVLNKWGVPIDLTNPDAFAWWQSNIQKYVDMGIEGFKLDYGEDIVPGVFGARSVWEFADGSDERTMHSQYRVLYHRAYGDLLGEDNFLLCRGGTYGDQVNVSVIWPGDLDADFSKHGEKIDGPDGSYNSVGGLPASLIAGMTLGPSGYPFYGADTGGYRHSPPDKELFTRWFQATALSVVMQIGTSSNDVAWEPTPENGFDQEMLEWYREYTRLHLRLFPYIWTYAKRLATDGRPIQRALGLAYPELGVHPDDTFLLGDHLLAAPVVARGQTSRDVMLPPGKWVDYWTGVSEDGNRTITANAPLNTLPLYLAAGGIVPMLRPTIDTLSPTSSPSTVDSFATSAGVLWVRVAPGPQSAFVLYDGSEIGQNDTGASVELSTKDGSVFSAGVMFELIGFGAAPASVLDGSALASQADLAALEAAPAGWFFDPALTGGTLFIKVPSGTHALTVTR